MNTYQTRILAWRDSHVRVEFIGKHEEVVEGRLIDVDVHNHKFLIQTAKGEEIIIMGAVKRITRTRHPDPDQDLDIPLMEGAYVWG